MQRLQLLKDTFFSLEAPQQQLVIGSAAAACGLLLYAAHRRGQVRTVPVGDGWWGAGRQPPSEDEGVYPFTVTTSDEEIEDLHRRLDRTRHTEPLEDCGFHYGFNGAYLQKVVSYWRNRFDWRTQVALLNTYPHFKTRIEGLDVHFVHVRPSPSRNQKVLPLMLVHGWPGSFYEFYRVLPLLTQNRDGVVFEVVVPSIPGYGYSQAPQKQGFDSLAAARVFLKLMERLGFSQFYLQGGDWGSLVTTNMAQMRPECVRGLHLNMWTSGRGLRVALSVLLGRHLPFLVGFSREDVRRLFPFFQKNLWEILRETGYLHIQGTKPDTAGRGLNDSPVGLAAYILEKFSTWTDFANRELEDGGLERKYTLDDLLTNIMIYWTTGCIVPSMRFYKENLRTNIEKRIDSLTGIFVPTGMAAFPHELMFCPRVWAAARYRHIVSFSFLPRGGHFAAFEEPQLLADDLVQFVRKVEKL